MARQLFKWNAPNINVTIDGQELETNEPSMIIVANSCQYAARLDPARDADMSDGQLDVVVLPIKSKLQLITWLVKCRRGSHLKDRRLIQCKGRHIKIVCDPIVSEYRFSACRRSKFDA